MEKSFTISSNADGLPLHGLVVEPNGEKKGILQILHGMREYKERYCSLMQFFAEHGYIVVCHDHRGHGDSVWKEEDRGYFYDSTGKAIVDDAAQITQYIKAQYPNLPVVLFGHSMGSMIARCYLQRYDDLVHKAIICGSPANNPLSGVAIALTKCIAALRGKRHRSKLLKYITTGKGAQRYEKVGESWLSRNKESIAKFRDNPKGKMLFSCNGYENLFRLMKMTYTEKAYQVKNPNLPIHFVSGTDDAVLGGKEAWSKELLMLKNVGYHEVTGKLYEGLRYEIFHDFGCEEVYADLLAFIEKE